MPPTDGLGRLIRLALPALVVLAAEPLYLLVDSAVVGHLGSRELAALAIGGGVLTMCAWLGTVLAYGTTGRAARQFGAGQRAEAVAEGVQASWLAIFAGGLLIVLGEVFAGVLCRALAGDAAIADAAAQWLRVAILGAPGLLLATAGHGWLRGVQDTRRPVRFALGVNVLSAVLCPVLVYPAGLGLVGSAVANAVAQLCGGVLFVNALRTEGVSLRPDWGRLRSQLTLGRDLLLRGAAFQVSFLTAAAVVARFGAPSLAAHQVALQLWMFCAFLLDAVAIAAQSLVGAALGAGDAAQAKRVARRAALLGAGAGTGQGVLVLLGAGTIPHWFSADPAVWAAAASAWPWFVAMQPAAGVVFALDGVLIGAGDARYLRNATIAAALCGFLPGTLAAAYWDLGLGGVWAALTLFVAVRLVAMLLRMRHGGWAVAGATR